MHIKSQTNFFSGLLFVLAGVGFAVGATNYLLDTSAKPGPGYFPLALSVLMTALGVAMLFKSLTLEVEGGDPIGRIAWRPLIAVPVAIVVFGAAVPRLGLLIAVAVSALIASAAGGSLLRRGVWIGCLLLTVAVWLVFGSSGKGAVSLWPAVAGF